MTKRVKIAVLGSLNYDCVAYGERLPKKGETVIGHGSGFFCGGKGANQAVQAARLGAEVYFIGRVGNDDIGSKMTESLKKEGINTDHITIDHKNASGTCCIFVDDNGDNEIMVAPGANVKIVKEDIDAAMPIIKECDIFISQLEVTIEVIEYAVKIVHQAGIKVVLDPAPACELDEQTYRYVDYLTPNETEAQIITGIQLEQKNHKSYAKTAKKLLDMGVKNVVLTLGAQGVYFANGQDEYFTPAYKIDALDSTAAGDAYNAGFACKIAEGKNLKEAIIYGCATGAVAASKKGAQSSLASRSEIDSFLARQELTHRN